MLKMTKNDIRSYWHTRAIDQKERTVGHTKYSLKQQNKSNSIRQKFILDGCPTHLNTLDYGCGIGRYAPFFPKYLGVDITSPLLDIAKQRNPTKDFELLSQTDLAGINYDVELFLTVTVLQHNPDDVVMEIFESLRRIKDSGFKMCLYENSTDDSYHMNKRNGRRYVEMVANFFMVKDYEIKAHKILRARHERVMIEV